MNVVDLLLEASLEAMGRALCAATRRVKNESEIGGVGNLAQWLDYAPYGSVIASENTGTTTAARLYIGQFSDASGLSYLNARYYNGAQGQFTSEDPLFLGNPSQQNLHDPQSLNSYSYSEDNPIVKSDQNGKQVEGLAASYGTGYLLGGETGPFDIAVGTAIGTALFLAANSSSMSYEPTAPGYPQVFQESLGQGNSPDPEFRGKLPPGWFGGLVGTSIFIGGTAAALHEGGWDDLLEAFGESGSMPSVSSGVQTNLSSPTMVNNLAQYFPSQVSQNDTTYYRNSSGLLSSTPQATVSSQSSSNSSTQSGGGSFPQSQQGYNELPGLFNPFIPH
jgi:RHS repeat-associated protein